MTDADRPEFDVIRHSATEPVVLSGPPESLGGELLLHNPGPEKLILRDIRVRGEAIAGRAAEAGGVNELALRRVVLRPGQLRRMPLQLGLSPNTPPGEYHAEVQVGGRVRALVIHVTEVVRLDIEPNPVVLDNGPGDKVSKHVVFTNRGNVPLHIGELGAVVIDEELLNCRTGRAAVMNPGKPIEGLDDYLAAIVRQTKEALEKTGLLRVHNTAGPFMLEPGEIRAVELEFRVPEKLEPRSRYLGSVALYTSNLDIVIVPTHADRPRRQTERRGAK